MEKRPDDRTISGAAALAGLFLTEEEKKEAESGLAEMLHFFEKLQEADTAEAEALPDTLPAGHGLRADVAENGDWHTEALSNAPLAEKDGFRVPRTVG